MRAALGLILWLLRIYAKVWLRQKTESSQYRHSQRLFCTFVLGLGIFVYFSSRESQLIWFNLSGYSLSEPHIKRVVLLWMRFGCILSDRASKIALTKALKAVDICQHGIYNIYLNILKETWYEDDLFAFGTCLGELKCL